MKTDGGMEAGQQLYASVTSSLSPRWCSGYRARHCLNPRTWGQASSTIPTSPPRTTLITSKFHCICELYLLYTAAHNIKFVQSGFTGRAAFEGRISALDDGFFVPKTPNLIFGYGLNVLRMHVE